jgi:hypothetical protein
LSMSAPCCPPATAGSALPDRRRTCLDCDQQNRAQ